MQVQITRIVFFAFVLDPPQEKPIPKLQELIILYDPLDTNNFE